MVRDRLEAPRPAGVGREVELRPPGNAEEVLAQALVHLTQREAPGPHGALLSVSRHLALVPRELPIPVRLHKMGVPAAGWSQLSECEGDGQQSRGVRSGARGKDLLWRLSAPAGGGR